MNLEEIIKDKKYNFLRENPHLKDKIIFLVVGGSHAYGTNVEGSDLDIRGVALNSKSDLLGLTNFEQYVDNDTDTTIYSLNKFFSLVSNCNPNVLEMLFCRPEDYCWISPIGKKLIENRKLFLSKRIIYTFGGYAHAQLNRLENALCRDNKLSKEKKEQNKERSVQSAINSFQSRYSDGITGDSIKLKIAKPKNKEEEEILVDINFKDFPLRDFRAMLSEMLSIVTDYDKNEGWRNRKKDDAHLNKHMMHLIRLYLVCNEALKTGDFSTFRANDHELLMRIRNGEFRKDDGGVKDEFYTLLNKLENDSNALSKETLLPNKPDFEKLNNFLIELNLEGLKNEK